MNPEVLLPIAAPPGVQLAGMPGYGEWLMILLIVIVIFGHNRIPQLGAALGQGIRNFKRSMSKDDEQQPAAKGEAEAEAEAPRPDLQKTEKPQDANKVL